MLLSLVILMLLLKPLFESELIAMCENTGLLSQIMRFLVDLATRIRM